VPALVVHLSARMATTSVGASPAVLRLRLHRGGGSALGAQTPQALGVPTFPRCIGWGRLAQEDADQSSLSFAKRSSASQVIDLSAPSGHNRVS
jgi:hypothetical protein